MATAHEMRDRLLRVDMELEIEDALNDTALVATDMNRDQLYEKGIDSTGKSLPTYKPSTIARKKRKGQRYDHMTLRDKGFFQDRLNIIVEGAKYVVFSNDEKNVLLQDKYPDILGLTGENKQKFWTESVKPSMVHSIAEKTGMGYGL